MLLYEIGYSLTENDDFVFNIDQLNFERVTKIAIDCFMVCIELQVRVHFSQRSMYGNPQMIETVSDFKHNFQDFESKQMSM